MALLLCAGACRRHHEPPAYEDTPIAAPPASPAPAPAAESPPGPPTAATAPAEAARMPDGGTINGDPRGPRAADFNRVQSATLPRLRACFEGAELPPGDVPVVLRFVVEPPGYTGAVAVRANVPKPIQDCCRNVISDLRFPEFHGPKVEQELTLTVQRREKPVQLEIGDASAKP
jgi:hypothetical protein